MHQLDLIYFQFLRSRTPLPPTRNNGIDDQTINYLELCEVRFRRSYFAFFVAFNIGYWTFYIGFAE